jgi:hypothetical protein
MIYVPKKALPIVAAIALPAASAIAQDGKDNTDFRGKTEIYLGDAAIGGSAGTKDYAFGLSGDMHLPDLLRGDFLHTFDTRKRQQNLVSGSGPLSAYTNIDEETERKETNIFAKPGIKLGDYDLAGLYEFSEEEGDSEINTDILIPGINYNEAIRTLVNSKSRSHMFGGAAGWKHEISDDPYRTLDIFLVGKYTSGDIKTAIEQLSSLSGLSTSEDEQDFNEKMGAAALMLDLSDKSYLYALLQGSKLEQAKDVRERIRAAAGYTFPLSDCTWLTIAGEGVFENVSGNATDADGGKVSVRWNWLPYGDVRPVRRRDWQRIRNALSLPDYSAKNADEISQLQSWFEARKGLELEGFWSKYGDLQSYGGKASYLFPISDESSLAVYGKYERDVLDAIQDITTDRVGGGIQLVTDPLPDASGKRRVVVEPFIDVEHENADKAGNTQVTGGIRLKF